MSRWAAFVWRIENYARDLPFGVGNRNWGALVGPGMQNRSNGRKHRYGRRSLFQLLKAPDEAAA